MTISEYFKNDVRDANLYTNYRVIPGIDNLKNTQRKCLYIMQKYSTGENKVSNMASIISNDTEYLHGNASLETVLSNLNISHDCSGNNLAVLKSKGQFGSKFNPDAIGASRYVYTSKSKIFDFIYRKEDIPLYKLLQFEGTDIEPTVLFPVLIPLYNAQYSIGNGFASYILPRNPLNLIKITREYLKSATGDIKPETTNLLTPFIKGFNGIIKNKGKNIWEFIGVFKKINNNTLEVTEIKPFMGLENYLKYLDKLVADKIIKSYKDESMLNNYKFIISVPTVFFEKYDSDEKIIKVLNLSETCTENITMFDENNHIIQYNSIEDYIKYFISWRLSIYLKRKNYILNNLQGYINSINEKARFIKYILDGELIISNTPKSEIIKFLESKKFNKTDFDTLLSMPIYSLTKEKFQELLNEINKNKKELEVYKKLTPSNLWEQDLKELENELNR